MIENDFLLIIECAIQAGASFLAVSKLPAGACAQSYPQKRWMTPTAAKGAGDARGVAPVQT
jgi:hypothetical protein